ncbi:hypothetical protein EKN06_08875 [Croceicoccus ponticola]|uniref:Lipoprotein n=1 Tax=Croceicoccus ponticola TaxID=2217664 RepID=A0A437GXB2_9SPHN|nr:hypothetical protein [Croceicoccus ponticola]RVQ67037.1 hypothetical protein EKN06_08875 [Croceicoccus ponticola]
MKKLALLAAFTLAACSGGEEAPAPAPEETATTAPATTAAVAAIDGGSSAGTFEVTSADGSTKLTQVLAEDGTLTSTDAEGKVVTGTWTLDKPAHYCSKQSDESEMTCYTETLAEDGKWTATNDADPADVWTVVRVK